MLAIRTMDLTKRYGTQTAVDALNLSIEGGELITLLGVNGAGKTTTIKMLCGLLPPTSGDAEILGDRLSRDMHRIKSKINASPQETAVARNLSVRENLELIAEIYQFGRAQAQRKAGEMMERLGLEEVARKRANALSGGMQRRLSIAMALISEPRILFLDEPTLGLDVLARRELWKLIGELKGKITILLTTHYMEEAEALSDRVGIMVEGRLRMVGRVAELVERSGASNFEDAFVALATKGGDGA